MLLYAHTITPRLQYVTAFLEYYYGQSVRATDNAQEFRLYGGVKLNYSDERRAEGELRIRPHPLLFEREVRFLSVSTFPYKEHKAFFRTEGDYPFDLPAAIFYLLSRYEEYLPFTPDEYGRYPHTASLACREGFLHLPLINIWLEDFRKLLAQKDAAFSTPNHSFSFLPTYDIDIAWSYRHKGALRNGGGLIRAALSGHWAGAKERLAVLSGRSHDPYDSYAWMEELHRQYGLKPLYFFHVGRERNRYDKNIPPDHPAQQALIQETAARYPVGLHPSWASGDHPALLSEEKQTLERLIGRAVLRSRQHYIRFQLPHTFRRLLDAGIRHDYSMGYGSANGFRASFAGSFYWYDLERNEPTELLLHPFCFMDANALFEQRLKAEEAYGELMQFYRVTKSAGGKLITIWHNSFLGTDPLFSGWRGKYRQFIAALYPER